MSAFEEVVLQTHIKEEKFSSTVVGNIFGGVITSLFIFFIFVVIGLFTHVFVILIGALLAIFMFFSENPFKTETIVKIRVVDCPACLKETVVMHPITYKNIQKVQKGETINDYDFECRNCHIKMHYLNEHVIYKRFKEES